MASSLGKFMAPKGAAQPLDAIPAMWRGTITDVSADGMVWVYIPRLSGPEKVGPMPTSVVGLEAGERVVVVAMEDSRNDLLVLSRLTDGLVSIPGRFSTVDLDLAPTKSSHATRKDYVDAQVATRAPATHTHTWAQVTGKPTTFAPSAHTHADATGAVAGFMPAADKAKLDAATYDTPPNTLVSTNANGYIKANAVFMDEATPQPANVHALTRKDYVDAQVATRALVTHRHTYADLDGLVPTSALPPLAVNDVFTVTNQAAMLALSAQRGDMAIRTDTGRSYALSADTPTVLAAWKELMATGQVVSVAGKTGVVSLTPSDVSLGNVNNTSDAAKPISTATQAALNTKANESHGHSAEDVTSGNFDWARMPAPIEILTTDSDLDTFLTTGVYHQGANARAATGFNYPIALAGLLEVFNPSGSMTYQRYTSYNGGNGNRIYWRGKYNAPWSPWYEVADARRATSTADGLLASTDKVRFDASAAKVEAAAIVATPYTLAVRNSAGQIQVATPGSAPDAANRGYVDGKTWDGADITTGTISPLRIANATTTLDGLMPKADKVKLDTATSVAGIGATVVMRTVGGHINAQSFFSEAAQSTASTALTRKDYVDAGGSGVIAHSPTGTQVDITSAETLLSAATVPVIINRYYRVTLSVEWYSNTANVGNVPVAFTGKFGGTGITGTEISSRTRWSAPTALSGVTDQISFIWRATSTVAAQRFAVTATRLGTTATVRFSAAREISVEDLGTIS